MRLRSKWSVTEVDNSMIRFRGTGRFSSELNSLLGFEIESLTDVERIYRTYGGVPASSFLVQSLTFSLPVRIPNLGLEIIPAAGGYLQSVFFGEDFYFVPDQGVTIQDFGLSLQTAPRYSLTGRYSTGIFGFMGRYSSLILDDSFQPYRDRIRTHNFEAEVSSYLSFPKQPRVEMFSTRTYGLLEFPEDGNLLGQAVQEVTAGFLISQEPRFLVHLNGVFNYQNSRSGSNVNYYTPLDVVEIKGGAKGTLSLHNSDWSRIFEFSLRGAAGWFRETGASSGIAENALKLEGQLSAAYSRGGNSTLYADVFVSGSFNEGRLSDMKYWQAAVTLGLSSRMPDLITE